MQELARQIQSYVDANNDPDNVSWSDSRFYIGSRRAGDSPVQHFQRITFGRCSFVSMSRTIVRSLEVLALLLFFVVTTPHSRCSVANVTWDLLASFGRMLALLGFWLAAKNCTNVRVARLVAGVKEAGIHVHDTSLAGGGADVLSYELSPANACCSGAGTRVARIRSVAERPGDGALQWSPVFSGAQLSWCSLSVLDASFKFACASDLSPENHG